jgi:hypothetical protein
MSDNQASTPQAPPGSGLSLDAQIRNYETQAREFAQITGLLAQLATMLGMFGLATGAIWLVLVPNSFRLPAEAVSAGYLVHGALSIVAALYFRGLARTIRQRRLFLRYFGADLYPTIENIGRRASLKLVSRKRTRCYIARRHIRSTRFGKWRPERCRRPELFGKVRFMRRRSGGSAVPSSPRLRWGLGEPIAMWALVPLVALAADALLAHATWSREERKRDLCTAGRILLFEASQTHELDRAKYLIDKLDCDAIETFWPAVGQQLRLDPWRY